jgi:polyhydroxybutyrate depolymerase
MIRMSKNSKLLVILNILLVVTLACARTGGSTPNDSPVPVGETTHTLTYDGLERSYILYVPASMNKNEPVPVVFVFHGGTGNARSAIMMSNFNEVANQHGFVVVYPNGTGGLSDKRILTWNAGDCCAYAQDNNVDDVGFVRAIMTDVQPLVSIDVKRVYATGMSNGAMLTQRLACEATDIFAAVAPVAGTLNFSPCQPSQPISVIEFHGTADRHVPFDGGIGPDSLVGVDFNSVQNSVEFWATFNVCNSQPQTNSIDNVQYKVWAECVDSTAVELYTIIGSGHSWPGGRSGWPGSDKPTQTISASQLIWDFFAAHPKP